MKWSEPEAFRLNEDRRSVGRRPASVNLYSKGIMKMGQQRILWFQNMTGFSWSDEGSYYVLHLMPKKGRNVLYGVPDAMTREKVEAVLQQNGLKETLTNTSACLRPTLGQT